LGIALLPRLAMSKTRRFWQRRFFYLAILDINIAGFSIGPVAEIIDRRGLPFFFVSGYGSRGRPDQFSKSPGVTEAVVGIEAR
jgi:hypothetical protein